MMRWEYFGLGCAAALLGVLLLIGSVQFILMPEPVMLRIFCTGFLWLLAVTWLLIADDCFHDWRGH